MAAWVSQHQHISEILPWATSKDLFCNHLLVWSEPLQRGWSAEYQMIRWLRVGQITLKLLLAPVAPSLALPWRNCSASNPQYIRAYLEYIAHLIIIIIVNIITRWVAKCQIFYVDLTSTSLTIPEMQKTASLLFKSPFATLDYSKLWSSAVPSCGFK